jgi:hypothetical protein
MSSFCGYFTVTSVSANASSAYSPKCVEDKFSEVDVMKKAFCYASCGKSSGKE